jgi:predicted Rdx family selenoprotein
VDGTAAVSHPAAAGVCWSAEATQDGERNLLCDEPETWDRKREEGGPNALVRYEGSSS